MTIQLQYLRLLKDIQAETGLAIISITPDFGIVARMRDRVAVMYAGRIVEQANVRDLFNKPRHPCTQALMDSVPKMDRRRGPLFRGGAGLERSGEQSPVVLPPLRLAA